MPPIRAAAHSNKQAAEPKRCASYRGVPNVPIQPVVSEMMDGSARWCSAICRYHRAGQVLLCRGAKGHAACIVYTLLSCYIANATGKRICLLPGGRW
jgi:hypothetical protein